MLDEINISYSIVAAAPLTIEVAPGGASAAEKVLDDAGLQYTARRVEDERRRRKCAIVVPPTIPAAISFRADYRTGMVQISLLNVDRLDRVSLAFQSTAIDEPVLEDLVRLVLGRSARRSCDARRWWSAWPTRFGMAPRIVLLRRLAV